jgi:hypothetical protein
LTIVRLRPATREERQIAWLWFAAAVSAIALRPVWIALAPWLRPCAFRSLTGIPCPTCGTTRTALAMLDLDLGTAFAANPLAAAAGLVFVIGGVLALPWLLLSGRLPILGWLRLRRVAWTVAAVAAINWAYLIATD